MKSEKATDSKQFNKEQLLAILDDLLKQEKNPDSAYASHDAHILGQFFLAIGNYIDDEEIWSRASKLGTFRRIYDLLEKEANDSRK